MDSRILIESSEELLHESINALRLSSPAPVRSLSFRARQLSGFLTPNDEAMLSTQRLLAEFGFTGEQIAAAFSLGHYALAEALDYLVLNVVQPSHQESSIELDPKCMICDAELSPINSEMLPCKHAFCNECLTSYLENKILEGRVLLLTCAHHNCQTLVPEATIARLLPQDLFSKYCYFKERNELMKNPWLKWCPRPDCTGYDIGGRSNNHLKCNVCTYQYCFYCSEAWHGRKRCKKSMDKQLDEWARSKNVRFCPSCRFRVQKNLGCNHMTCSQCSYEWCWMCGKQYFPGHFEQCDILKKRWYNIPWFVGLLMLFAIPLAPISPFVLYFLHNHFSNFEEDFANDTGCLNRFVATRWRLFYPLLLALSPLIFSLTLLGVALFGGCVIMVVIDEYIMNNPKCCQCVGGILLGPLILALVVLAYCLVPFMGLLFFAFKLGIVLVRLCSPSFMRPNVEVGYEFY
jgi:hypothetical protein